MVYVWPNCSAPRFTHDGIDLEWIDEEADRENERALVARLALDEPPPPDPAGVGAAAPNEEASGSQTGKAAAAQPSGHGGAAVAPAPPAGTDPLTDPLPKRFGSIMEAVEAVVPGSVIKLLAGRHLVSQFDRTGVKRWPNFTLRKSVQVVVPHPPACPQPEPYPSDRDIPQHRSLHRHFGPALACGGGTVFPRSSGSPPPADEGHGGTASPE